jgi:hypothetical protein
LPRLYRCADGSALEIYARKMERERETGSRMDALIRGADLARVIDESGVAT